MCKTWSGIFSGVVLHYMYCIIIKLLLLSVALYLRASREGYTVSQYHLHDADVVPNFTIVFSVIKEYLTSDLLGSQDKVNKVKIKFLIFNKNNLTAWFHQVE